MEITHHLFELCPSLCPPEHGATIRQLIEELHDISFLALAFFKPRHQAFIQNANQYIEDWLARTDILTTHRKALEWKLN